MDNQQECNRERDLVLAETLGDGDATWPRVGTLLSVKADLADVMAKLPEVAK